MVKSKNKYLWEESIACFAKKYKPVVLKIKLVFKIFLTDLELLEYSEKYSRANTRAIRVVI